MRFATARPSRKAFTLVELVTAASLMTVMMLGVVEIFGIVVQTAGDAEGIHFAQQQLRAFFDRLNTDIRGMTREGYLSIKKGYIDASGSSASYRAESALGQGDVYGADTLSFVTIGVCQDQMGTTGAQLGGTASEVVYTNNVPTDGSGTRILQVDGQNVSPQRGILARGLWIIDGDPAAGGYWNSKSAHGYLCQLFAAENEKIMNMSGKTTEQEPDLVKTGSARKGAVTVTPWIPEDAGANLAHPGSLNRVMACCVSEFFVEACTPVSSGASTTYWHGDDDADRTYRWSETFQESSGDSLEYDSGHPIESWPAAIRVTVALHDPGESTEIPQGQNRYHGYAMQETFWIGDP